MPACLLVHYLVSLVAPWFPARWLSACPIGLHQSPRSLGSWPGVVPEVGVRARPRFRLSTRGSLVDSSSPQAVPLTWTGRYSPSPVEPSWDCDFVLRIQ